MLFWSVSEVWNDFDFLSSLIDQKFRLEYSIAAVMRVSADLRSPSTSNMAREPQGMEMYHQKVKIGPNLPIRAPSMVGVG